MSDTPATAPSLPPALPDGVIVRCATETEAEAIAGVIRSAFATVAESLGVDIPPMHETAADVLGTFAAGDAILVAETDRVIVGTVRGETLDGDRVMVRRLAVLPEHRGAGIARSLMCALEDAYPQAARFELFTGALASGPLALYESLGYVLFDEREAAPGLTLVSLEKKR